MGIVRVAPARRPPAPPRRPASSGSPATNRDGLLYVRYRNTDGRLVSGDELEAHFGLPATYGLDSPQPR